MVLNIVFLIAGILFSVLGIALLKRKQNGYLIWFTFNKYDNDKVLYIISVHLILLGVVLMGTSRIHYVVISAYSKIIVFTMLVVGIVIILSSCWQIYKYARIVNQGNDQKIKKKV